MAKIFCRRDQICSKGQVSQELKRSTSGRTCCMICGKFELFLTVLSSRIWASIDAASKATMVKPQLVEDRHKYVNASGIRLFRDRKLASTDFPQPSDLAVSFYKVRKKNRILTRNSIYPQRWGKLNCFPCMVSCMSEYPFTSPFLPFYRWDIEWHCGFQPITQSRVGAAGCGLLSLSLGIS